MAYFARILSGYITSMGSYGFYRGYNNLYNIAEYNTKTTLITENSANGLLGTFYQLNPIYQPVFLYGIARRTEKKMLNLDINKNDYEF